jgi:hypothetical protein
MYVRDDKLYLCDTGNDRVLELKLGTTGAVSVREIASGDGWSLSAPEESMWMPTGQIFICDTGNRRILCLMRRFPCACPSASRTVRFLIRLPSSSRRK